MSDRKYRQRGYQDGGGETRPPRESPSGPSEPRAPGKPAGNKTDREPRAVNVPAFHQTMKCTRCGTEIGGYSAYDAVCTRCGAALHSCIQCSSFDPGQHYECMQPITARIVTKDAANTCTLFEPRVRVERQTGSAREAGPTSAKDAFDKLFKF